MKKKKRLKNLVKPFKSEGKIAKTETDAKLGTTTWTLSNGAKVTFKKLILKMMKLFSQQEVWGSSLINDADYNKTQFAFPALSEAGVNGFRNLILPII